MSVKARLGLSLIRTFPDEVEAPHSTQSFSATHDPVEWPESMKYWTMKVASKVISVQLSPDYQRPCSGYKLIEMLSLVATK